MINQNPFFSVIIPTRNRSALLKICIGSVVAQIYKDWELIIIDDGSEDETREVVAAFEDNRIQYCFQEHQERSNARNRGIDAAKGKYVCFIDDDDYVTERYLSEFNEFYTSHKVEDLVLRTGFVKIIDEKEINASNYDAKRHKNPVNFVLYNMCGVGCLCIPRISLTEDKFPSQFPHWQDTHLFVRLLLKYEFKQLESHNYKYYHHKKMGSKKATIEFDPLDRAALNVAAIDDLFVNYGTKIANYASKKTLPFLKAEKYIEYSNSLRREKKMERRKLLLKSLESGFFFRLWKHYLIWLKVKI